MRYQQRSRWIVFGGDGERKGEAPSYKKSALSLYYAQIPSRYLPRMVFRRGVDWADARFLEQFCGLLAVVTCGSIDASASAW